MAKKRGRDSKRRGPQKGGGKRPGRPGRKQRGPESAYFTQPGRRGAVVVLRKPIGNRATPKVCGTMPTRQHAQMLISSLEKAESVVKDLFMEATDDGIEALEAVLAACCEEVMRRGPRVPQMAEEPAGEAESSVNDVAEGESLDDGPAEDREPDGA